MRRKEKEKKTIRRDIRLTEQQNENLLFIMDETGESATNVIVEALRMYGNLVKRRIETD